MPIARKIKPFFLALRDKLPNARKSVQFIIVHFNPGLPLLEEEKTFLC